VFPFEFGGVTYSACTTNNNTGSAHSLGTWCSTRVDLDGKHVEPHRGVCPEDGSCPICKTTHGKVNQYAIIGVP
jgi:hypothetical protein